MASNGMLFIVLIGLLFSAVIAVYKDSKVSPCNPDDPNYIAFEYCKIGKVETQIEETTGSYLIDVHFLFKPKYNITAPVAEWTVLDTSLISQDPSFCNSTGCPLISQHWYSHKHTVLVSEYHTNMEYNIRSRTCPMNGCCFRFNLDDEILIPEPVTNQSPSL